MRSVVETVLGGRMPERQGFVPVRVNVMMRNDRKRNENNIPHLFCNVAK